MESNDKHSTGAFIHPKRIMPKYPVSRFETVDETEDFVLQRRKKVNESKNVMRIITRHRYQGSYFIVTDGDNLTRQWFYVSQHLQKLIPQQLIGPDCIRDRTEWLIAHFTKLSLENEDAASQVFQSELGIDRDTKFDKPRIIENSFQDATKLSPKILENKSRDIPLKSNSHQNESISHSLITSDKESHLTKYSPKITYQKKESYSVNSDKPQINITNEKLPEENLTLMNQSNFHIPHFLSQVHTYSLESSITIIIIANIFIFLLFHSDNITFLGLMLLVNLIYIFLVRQTWWP